MKKFIVLYFMFLASCDQVDSKGKILNYQLPAGLSDCSLYEVKGVGKVIRCPGSQVSVDDGYADKINDINTIIDNGTQGMGKVVRINDSNIVVMTENIDTVIVRKEKYDTIRTVGK